MPYPSLATVKRLFAVSGNCCAFPGCDAPLIDAPSGKVVGRICHIAGSNGPRHDPQQSAKQRHGYENLLLLCSPHHDVIDADVDKYTVDVLRLMKARHEHATENTGLTTDQARAFLNIVKESSVNRVVASLNQSGGQVAHTITNIVHTSGTSLRESDIKPSGRRTAALDDLWQYMLAALDATLRATVNLGPCKHDVHRQSFDTLAGVPFPEMKSGSELDGWSSFQNDYLHVMAFPHFGNAANTAINELAHCGARARLFVSATVLQAVNEVVGMMREAVAQARDAKTSEDRWRHLFGCVHRIECKVVPFEHLIKNEMCDGG